jgi:hypothetical protein
MREKIEIEITLKLNTKEKNKIGITKHEKRSILYSAKKMKEK